MTNFKACLILCMAVLVIHCQANSMEMLFSSNKKRTKISQFCSKVFPLGPSLSEFNFLRRFAETVPAEYLQYVSRDLRYTLEGIQPYNGSSVKLLTARTPETLQIILSSSGDASRKFYSIAKLIYFYTLQYSFEKLSSKDGLPINSLLLPIIEMGSGQFNSKHYEKIAEHTQASFSFTVEGRLQSDVLKAIELNYGKGIYPGIGGRTIQEIFEIDGAKLDSTQIAEDIFNMVQISEYFYMLERDYPVVGLSISTSKSEYIDYLHKKLNKLVRAW